MSEIMEIIRNRRSIRRFQEKDIPEAVLACVLDFLRMEKLF